ncbi:MAG: hypothetical protein ACLS7Z_04730 [Christensenellales bacterium]
MIDRIDRKREVLVHVAKYCFEGTLEAHKEFIPLEIVPHGSQPTTAAASTVSARCCATAWIGPAAARPSMTAKTTTPLPTKPLPS